MSYAWDFGDGDIGTGRDRSSTPTTRPGSYVVKTDGDRRRRSHQRQDQVVTVPDGAQPFALDEFNRTQASGLGTADLGGSLDGPGGQRIRGRGR